MPKCKSWMQLCILQFIVSLDDHTPKTTITSYLASNDGFHALTLPQWCGLDMFLATSCYPAMKSVAGAATVMQSKAHLPNWCTCPGKPWTVRGHAIGYYLPSRNQIWQWDIYLYISISLYLYISISLYLYISISLYLYISISLYLYISISLSI